MKGTRKLRGKIHPSNLLQTNKKKWWRRGELNPRPRSLATRRLHAYPDPKVSLEELRAGKTRLQLVR